MELERLCPHLTEEQIKQFRWKNKRRLELIEKKHSTFTDEEMNRPFGSDNPGWYIEFEERKWTNLTKEEKEEWEELQDCIYQFLQKNLPDQDTRDRIGAGGETE